MFINIVIYQHGFSIIWEQDFLLAAQMHYLTAIPNFTWTTGCPGLCPWSPSLPACSDGKAHSAERAFALGDPPCSHAVASPSASQNHNGFHSPLERKKEKESWEFNLLHSFMMHFLKIFNGNSVPTVLKKQRSIFILKLKKQ